MTDPNPKRRQLCSGPLCNRITLHRYCERHRYLDAPQPQGAWAELARLRDELNHEGERND